MELTREELKKLLHSATGNIKDFVTNNDKFIDDWITENKVNNVVSDDVIKCNHDFKPTTMDGEFDGNKCIHCGEYEDLT